MHIVIKRGRARIHVYGQCCRWCGGVQSFCGYTVMYCRTVGIKVEEERTKWARRAF